MLRLIGHVGAVNAVAFSPDGETIITAGVDGSVRIWEPPLEVACVRDHVGSVLCMDVRRDGHAIIAGGADGKLFVGGKLLLTTSAVVAGVRWFPDDRRCVVVRGRAIEPTTLRGLAPALNILLVDVTTGIAKQLPIDTGKPGTIAAFAACRKTRMLAWSIEHRTYLHAITGSTITNFGQASPAQTLAFSPDGNTLAVALRDWKIDLYDIAAGRIRQTLPGHKGSISTLAFTPDGRRLLSGSMDQTVKIWDVLDGRELASFAWPIGQVMALAVSPDGSQAVAAGNSGIVLIWDMDA